MKQHTINYYTLIPPSLHKDVDALLDYLSTYPFKTPSRCTHCGSKRFYEHNINPLSKIINYRCRDCKRAFNQLTNTCFTKTQYIHLHKWDDFAKLRFAGKSVQIICEILNLSIQAAVKRDIRIKELMQQQYPTLFIWWTTHQDREKLDFSKPIEQQINTFTHWLKKIITQTIATCPSCGRTDCKKAAYAKKYRPQFQCNTCEISFNLLSTTHLLRMYYPERWLDYIKLLSQGYSDNDISKQLNIRASLSSAWRYKFIKQMQALELTDLIQWLTWQRSRRYNQVSKEIRLRLKAK